MLQLHTNRLISPNNLLYDFGNLEYNELGKSFWGGGSFTVFFLSMCMHREGECKKHIYSSIQKGEGVTILEILHIC